MAFGSSSCEFALLLKLNARNLLDPSSLSLSLVIELPCEPPNLAFVDWKVIPGDNYSKYKTMTQLVELPLDCSLNRKRFLTAKVHCVFVSLKCELH